MTDRTRDALDGAVEGRGSRRTPETGMGWAASPQADAILQAIVSGGMPVRRKASHHRSRASAPPRRRAGAGGRGGRGGRRGPRAPAPETRAAGHRERRPGDAGRPSIEPRRAGRPARGRSPTGSLYVATLADGGYCFEIVTDRRRAGSDLHPGSRWEASPSRSRCHSPTPSPRAPLSSSEAA